jgi:2-polyprenyl-3-methyl-5-hydroxy-6-metoxy-1,4-benzoquinol methylase
MSGNSFPIPAAPGNIDDGATEEIHSCPACASGAIAFMVWAESAIRKTWFCYFRCQRCGLVFINPRDPTVFRERNQTRSTREVFDHFVQSDTFDMPEIDWNVIGPVSKILPPKTPEGNVRRWLDVGCAAGALLTCARRRGYAVRGVDPNGPLVSWTREARPELNIMQGFAADLPDSERFDIVSADNVLEHINEPADFLGELRKRMTDDSLLALRVPNYNNFARPVLEMLGRLPRSFILDCPAHTCNYSRKPLEFLLDRCGFASVRTIERLMISYPLRIALGHIAPKWPKALRQAAASLIPAFALVEKAFPPGGVDITVLARKSKD